MFWWKLAFWGYWVASLIGVGIALEQCEGGIIKREIGIFKIFVSTAWNILMVIAATKIF